MTSTYLDLRTLRRAAEIAGGEAQLALRLRVSRSELSVWLAGQARLPNAVFLRAVDVVLEHEHAALGQHGDPENRRE